MTVRILHNPRCSKSRQTLELLTARGIEPLVVEYLKDAPSKEEIADLLGKLGKRPREILRKGEDVYKSMKLADPAKSDAELIEAMAANPILIERPIVVNGDRAVLGRPPESVLDIF